MAFYTGNFSSFASLKTSVESALGTEGWSSSNGILSKSGVYVRLTATADQLLLEAGTGQTGSTLDGSVSSKILSHVGAPFNFPAAYDLHVFNSPDEVYLVVNYNADRYQQLSFGKSNVEQIGGTGAWMSASFNSGRSAANNQLVYMAASGESLGASYSGFSLGLFFEHDGTNVPSSAIHTGLDSTGWKTVYLNDGNLHGAGDVVAGMMASLPSDYNQNTVLLPINVAQKRLSQGLTIVASLVNARLCRNDNHLAGEVVEYGGESWKVYPFHRKNADQRNGVAWSTGADHSGTYAFAIRYTGP